MNLGETIYRLRTEKNMSQGDLADALDVSRQSVSKWETGGSVPDLDKLIKLSEIFDVTLDELVLNRQPQPQTQPVTQAAAPKPVRSEVKPSQKTTGTILCCFSAIVWLLVSLFGDVLAGLVLAAPFLTCGLICMFAARRAGLWCAWAVYLFVDIYLRYATGVNWKFVMGGLFYEGGWTAQLIIAWCLLFLLTLMLFLTVLSFVKRPVQMTRPQKILLIVGWCLFALSFVPIPIVPSYMFPRAAQLVIGIVDWARNVLLALLLIGTIQLIRSRRKTV
jgi:transcriptional regulator with XRE-family HTH domain